MLIGMIRLRETRTFTVHGEELDEIQDKIREQSPAGWETISAPVVMAKKDTTMTAEGTITRRDGVTATEADDMTAIAAKIPKGYQLLSVRRV